MYEETNGDIRFILNILQLLLLKNESTKNIQTTSIFNSTEQLLSMDLSIEEKIKCYWMNYDLHNLMIHENYINNTFYLKSDPLKQMENLSDSSDSLSDSDLFNSIFDFELSQYVVTNTIKATSNCNKKTTIKFPQYLSKVSLMNKNKRDNLNYENVSFFKKEDGEKKVVKEKVVKEKKEKVVKEKVVKEKVVKEKVVKEKVVKEKVVKEKVVKEKVVKEKVFKEKVFKEKVVKEKVVKEKVFKEKLV
jgi:hypothetical protein